MTKFFSNISRLPRPDLVHPELPRIAKIHHEIDINTLHRIEGVTEISVNAIARIQIKTASEVLVDDYRRNKTTGSFLLIDPSTHQTMAAGVIDDLNTQA